MRPIFANQPEIERLSQPLAQAMRMNNAAIQKGWNTEHQGDGTHTDVTATSAAVSGLTTLGRIKLTEVTIKEAGTGGGAAMHNVYTPGLESASCVRLVPIVTTGFAFFLSGIEATGRQPGELLLLLNTSYDASGAAVVLRLEDTNSNAPNRFGQYAAISTAYILSANRGVWLCYNYRETSVTDGTTIPRWWIIGETEVP